MVIKLAMKFQIVLLSVLFSITTSYPQDKEKTMFNNIVIRGAVNYDIIMSTITKEEFDVVKNRESTRLLNDSIIPSQVHITEDCYTVTTNTKTVKNCLDNDEQLISVSYLGFVKALNSCVVSENWFEATTSNLLIHLIDGTTSNISGYDLIFSPTAKFIYSYANDGIDFSGISLHQMINNTATPIFISDYTTLEDSSFDFSSFGRAFWVSDSSFYAGNTKEFYKFKIQDKRITYNNEVKESILHSENSKFIIKVDKLKNGTIRYTSWNKTNTIKERPSLVLYNGEVEQQDKYGSGLDYRFENGEYQYIIEHNVETTGSKHIMLRLLKENEELLYTSLNDLKTKL